MKILAPLLANLTQTSSNSNSFSSPHLPPAMSRPQPHPCMSPGTQETSSPPQSMETSSYSHCTAKKDPKGPFSTQICTRGNPLGSP